MTGCQGKLKGQTERKEHWPSGEVTTTTTVEAEITWSARMMRSSSEMIANATGFTFDDWAGLDVSQYEMELNSSFGLSTLIPNNKATIKVFSNGHEIGSQSFSLVQSNNKYKFSHPTAVKQWSLDFVDTADKVSVITDSKSDNSSPLLGHVNVKYKKGNSLIVNIEHSVAGTDGCEEHLNSPIALFCGGL